VAADVSLLKHPQVWDASGLARAPGVKSRGPCEEE
jgi:hypothetical protein